MLDLITYRTQADVDRAVYLRNKINGAGWSSLTADEQDEYKNGSSVPLADENGELLYDDDNEQLFVQIDSLLGEYRHVDRNRVGKAVDTLSDYLNAYGYPVTVYPKTDWTHDEIPSATQMTAYLANIAAIKNRFYGTTSLPSTIDYLTHTAANNIELLLQEIETYINNMIAGFKYSGMFNSGQGAGL